jgi:hypothetical protein
LAGDSGGVHAMECRAWAEVGWMEASLATRNLGGGIWIFGVWARSMN